MNQVDGMVGQCPHNVQRSEGVTRLGQVPTEARGQADGENLPPPREMPTAAPKGGVAHPLSPPTPTTTTHTHTHIIRTRIVTEQGVSLSGSDCPLPLPSTLQKTSENTRGSPMSCTWIRTVTLEVLSSSCMPTARVRRSHSSRWSQARGREGRGGALQQLHANSGNGEACSQAFVFTLPNRVYNHSNGSVETHNWKCENTRRPTMQHSRAR